MSESVPTPVPLAEERQHCITESLHCHGTAYVFGERAKLLRWRLKLMSFFGLVVPGLVGISIGSFGVTADATIYLISLAAVAALPQFVLSVWSLVDDWTGSLSYADESVADNTALADAFERLARNLTLEPQEFVGEMRLLDQRNDARSTSDQKRDASDDEKRMGMRAGLRQLQKACASCGQIPVSLEPSDCDVCGNFKRRRF
jgi:mobilome CxxCx(11)CxxC protein